jgi:tetratricopeptide (TPR) repeat protein
VAAYLNRDVSTVRRWERREGLPIHRLRHESRDSIFADTAEIDAWLQGRNRVQHGAPAVPDVPIVAAWHASPLLEVRSGRRFSRTATWLSLGLAFVLVMVPVSLRDRSDASTTEAKARLTRNADALRFYLRGRQEMDNRNREGFTAAVEDFRQAIAKDPEFAMAFTGLADAHSLMGYYRFRPPAEANDEARIAALHALKLDDTLAEAHTSLAGLLAYNDWNWSEAEREYLRAIELNPSHAPARHWYANNLSLQGRHEDAIAQARAAADLQPLSLIILTGALGHAYTFAGRYEDAAAVYRSALEHDRRFANAHYGLAKLYWRQGRLTDARQSMQRAVDLDSRADWTAVLAALDAALGDREPARALLATLERDPEAISAISFATVHAQLGQVEQALTVLERALEQRDPTLPSTKDDPGLDPIRGQPRFEAILRRINLF